MNNFELTLLKGLIYDETFARRVLPYVKEVYFETSVGRILFEICKKHFTQYDSCATTIAIGIEIEKLSEISSDEFNSITDVYKELRTRDSINQSWLIDESERWCQERAVHLALLDALVIHDGKDKKRNRDAIPGILTEALAVCFDPHVGHEYLSDYDERYDFYHNTEERISTGLFYFDKITKGGFPNKSLNIALAGTGVGKSLCMCSLAASMLMAGTNILYITMEMSEERIAERIDANLLNTKIDEIIDISKSTFRNKINSLTKKTQGQLFIKEYPTASVHAGHFDALLKEISIKKSFKPDIIFIDYLNICISQRYSSSSSYNSYTVVKGIAEELRGLAVKHNLPVFSATQTTRTGYDSSDPGLTDTSESFGLPATADFMFALISNDDLLSRNQIMVKQLKNRYNDPNLHNKFFVGVDYGKMRLYDIEGSSQGNILQQEAEEKVLQFNKNKFALFSMD